MGPTNQVYGVVELRDAAGHGDTKGVRRWLFVLDEQTQIPECSFQESTELVLKAPGTLQGLWLGLRVCWQVHVGRVLWIDD